MMFYSKFDLAKCWMVAVCCSLLLSVHLAIGHPSQPTVIQGTVSDSLGGLPLVGATVSIKGTNQTSQTDDNGKFSIQAVLPATLVVSFTGYVTRVIPVDGTAPLSISLVSDEEQLEEVVVVGYATTKRQDYAGSVGSVKLEDSPIALAPNLSILESLKGAVTGMNIGATNSAGGQPDMIIRGQNSINGSNVPLIVLDGVIFMGTLADINPNDIASIDVLKDAVSAAAYGSRAGNGIIAITTKKGRSSKPQITFNSSTGIQSWQNQPKLMKGEDWLRVVNERNGRAVGETSFMLGKYLENYNAGIERAWLDDVTRTGVMQDHQVAFSGVGEGVNYYLSTSYNDNKSVVVGDDFQRVSVLGKISTDITSWLKVGVDGSFSRRDYSGEGANLNSAQALSPYAVMFRDDQGNLEKYPLTQSIINPLWQAESGTYSNQDHRFNYRLNTYAVVSLPWVEGLSYRVNFLPNLEQIRQKNFYDEGYYVLEGDGIDRYSPGALQNLLSRANGNLYNSSEYSYVFDNILTYSKPFGRHGVEGTLVATRDYSKYELSNVTASDFSDNGSTALRADGLHNASVQRLGLTGTKRTNIGYLARINYSFDSKYYLTASVRRDGASVFGANMKYGNFASVGGAWRISEEEFLAKVDVLNSLKLKVSWGLTGNQGVDPYSTLSRIANGVSGGFRYQFHDNPGTIYYGSVQSTLGNYGLGWESTDTWNFGFESSWLNHRLFIDLDMYASKTFDQIFTRQIPVMTGFKTIMTSMGQVNNKGAEVTVRSVNLRNDKINWSTSLTFWMNRNKLAKLYGEDLNGDGVEDDDISNSLFIGKSLGAIYGYKQIGIVQVGDTDYMAMTGANPGDPKYADLDGESGITAADRTILGYEKENFRLNLGNTISVDRFEFYMLVTGVFGGNNFFLKSNTPAYLSTTDRGNDNMPLKPYWTAENPNEEYPRVNFTGDGGRFLGLQSRGFVRLQDVSLSYTFDQPWVRSANISSLKVFLAAKNLATFTNWVGLDPETGARFLDNVYPVVSTYSFGVNLTF